MSTPQSEQHKPISIQLHRRSRVLEIDYDNG